MPIKNVRVGNSLLAHWLILSTSIAWGTGSIPDGGKGSPSLEVQPKVKRKHIKILAFIFPNGKIGVTLKFSLNFSELAHSKQKGVSSRMKNIKLLRLAKLGTLKIKLF